MYRSTAPIVGGYVSGVLRQESNPGLPLKRLVLGWWVVVRFTVCDEKAWHHIAEMVLNDQNEGGEQAGSL